MSVSMEVRKCVCVGGVRMTMILPSVRSTQHTKASYCSLPFSEPPNKNKKKFEIASVSRDNRPHEN